MDDKKLICFECGKELNLSQLDECFLKMHPQMTRVHKECNPYYIAQEQLEKIIEEINNRKEGQE